MNKIKKKTEKYYFRQVHKFGGSSLSTIQSCLKVAKIIINYSKPGDLIVVSASGKTTEQLMYWLELKEKKSILANKVQKNIFHYHKNLINGLLSLRDAYVLKKKILNDFDYLNFVFNAKKENDFKSEIIGYGEIWSACIISFLLKKIGFLSTWVDSRLFLRTNFSIKPKIHEKSSRILLKKILKKNWNKYVVITGFIAKNNQGKTVLLGRNGSDYSATQIASLLNVNKVTIWSDVLGIYTADPKKVKNSHFLPFLTFEEANELARLSKTVLHERTLEPILNKDINLQFKCSFFPKKSATKLKKISNLKNGSKIITNQNHVCLVELNLKNKIFFVDYYQKCILFLKKKCLYPLAVGLNKNKRIVKFCYPIELGKFVVEILKKKFDEKKLILRKNFSLIALISSNIVKNSFFFRLFYKILKNQPVEFIYHSYNKISLIAILRKKNSSNLVRYLHRFIFQKKNKNTEFNKNKSNF